jgi:D-alanyl-lipoteichoic acid acyltransferase DltB (MBOAT superfamily)
LVASYVFYGWWDWRFLSLIFYSSLIDFWVGWRIGQSTDPTRRKLYLLFSLITNLGLLGFFKYHNFFAESFATVLNSFGVNAGPATLNIVLPVGISFYTFQALSYTIDVYRRRCPAHSDLIEFLAFISFFPQLVAGPIERATNLLGQFTVERQFDLEKAKDGLRQMLWEAADDKPTETGNIAFYTLSSSGCRTPGSPGCRSEEIGKEGRFHHRVCAPPGLRCAQGRP